MPVLQYSAADLDA